jgi:hypothetical protein
MSEHNLTFNNDGFGVTLSLTTESLDERMDNLLWARVSGAVMQAISEPIAITGPLSNEQAESLRADWLKRWK